MTRPFLLRATLALGLLAIGFPACTPRDSDFIRPQTALADAPLTVASARSWYQAQAAPFKTAVSAARSSTSTANPVAGPLPIDWASAVDTTTNSQKVVFAPIRDFGRRFTDAGYQSYRYLVVARSVSTQLSGLVVEVLLKDSHQPSKALERALLARLYNHHRSAAETLPGNFTGFAFFYTANYQYLTGTGYAKGKPLAGTMRLTRAVPVVTASPKQNSPVNKTTGCDTYLIKGGTDSAYLLTLCYSTPDFGGLDPGQPGFFDPGYGGLPDAPTTGDGSTGGGGTVSAISPNTVLFVPPPPTHKIQNVPDHLKCFNKAQGATFSVYATQPKPGTRATWSGSITDPNVGHTFVSITQGGITRVVGFYPSAGITPLNPSGPSTLADDSDHDYSVRIDISLTPNQLDIVLNYILNYPGTYDLNSYNCTDFGIGAAGAAGLSLPATQGSWAPGSGGLNPGDLGQDMRTMSLPAGAKRDVQSGQADSDNGSC